MISRNRHIIDQYSHIQPVLEEMKKSLKNEETKCKAETSRLEVVNYLFSYQEEDDLSSIHFFFNFN